MSFTLKQYNRSSHPIPTYWSRNNYDQRRVPTELRLGHKCTVKGIYQKPQIAYPMEKIFKDLRIGKRVDELVKKW